MIKDTSIRLIEGKGMQRIAERLLAINQPLPNPLLSSAFAVENADRSIGSFIVIQGVTLVEPLVVQAQDVGTMVPLQLLHEAAKYVRTNKFRRTFMHSTDPYIWKWLTTKRAMPIPDTERFFEWRGPCV